MSRDPFGHDDAAYVLGALGPVERKAFEEHLPGCASCTRAVADLAGLPSLLATLDESAFDDPETAPPVPDTLLPRLLGEVRRRRRRTRLLVLAGAAASVVLAAVVAGTLLLGGAAPGPGAPDRGRAQAMTQVHQDQLSATVALDGVAWGTRMRLTCTYAGDDWGGTPPAYALVVRTRDGASEQVATWRAVPDAVARLQAATAADPDQIAAVDVVVAGTQRRVLTLAPG